MKNKSIFLYYYISIINIKLFIYNTNNIYFNVYTYKYFSFFIIIEKFIFMGYVN